MKTSVIIPTYNSHKTIEKTLRSILKQSLLPLEVLIVDDNSGDSTIKTVEDLRAEFIEKGINYIVEKNQINCGPSYSRNVGLKKAQGQLLMFLDADDYWLPEKIELVTNIFSSQVDINYLAHAFSYSLSEIDKLDERIVKYNMFHFLLKNRVTTPSFSLRKSHTLYFDESMRYCEDYDLYLRILSQDSIYYLNKPLCILNRILSSKGGLSGSVIKMRLGELKAITKLCFSNKKFLLIYPFLVLLSGLKFLRRLAFAN